MRKTKVEQNTLNNAHQLNGIVVGNNHRLAIAILTLAYKIWS